MVFLADAISELEALLGSPQPIVRNKTAIQGKKLRVKYLIGDSPSGNGTGNGTREYK